MYPDLHLGSGIEKRPSRPAGTFTLRCGRGVKGRWSRRSPLPDVVCLPLRRKEWAMSYVVDFDDVSTTGLESSPVAPALAGLRANEARYFKNKYDHDFTVEPASSAGRPSTGCSASSRRSATSSSRLGHSRRRGFQGADIPHGVRVLRERPVDQRDVPPSTTPRNARSGSSSPTAWRFLSSSPRNSSSHARSRSWPGPSEARSRSRASTDLDLARIPRPARSRPRPTSWASARPRRGSISRGLYRRTGCLNAAQAAYRLVTLGHLGMPIG